MAQHRNILLACASVAVGALSVWAAKSAYRGKMIPIGEYVHDYWDGMVFAVAVVALLSWYRSRASGA